MMEDLKKQIKAFDGNLYVMVSLILIAIASISALSIVIRGIIWFFVLFWGIAVFFMNFNRSGINLNKTGVFVLWFVIALLFTNIYHGAFVRYGLGYLLISSVFLISFFFCDDDFDYLLLFRMLALFFFLVAAFDIILLILSKHGISFVVVFSERLEGLLGNPNGVGMGASLGIMSLVALAMKDWDLKKNILRLFMAVILAIDLFLSASRNAILSLFGFLFLAFFLFVILHYQVASKENRRKILITACILVLCAVLFLLMMLLVPPFSDLFLKYFRFSGGTSGRVEIWKAGVKGIRDHLFLGVQQTRMMEIISEYNPSVADINNESGVHNTYIQVALVGGLLTAIPFYLLFIIFFAGLKILILKGKIKKDDIVQVTLVSSIFFMLCLSNIFESFGISSIMPSTLLYYFFLARGLVLFKRIKSN